jgi:hypothetical protein
MMQRQVQLPRPENKKAARQRSTFTSAATQLIFNEKNAKRGILVGNNLNKLEEITTFDFKTGEQRVWVPKRVKQGKGRKSRWVEPKPAPIRKGQRDLVRNVLKDELSGDSLDALIGGMSGLNLKKSVKRKAWSKTVVDGETIEMEVEDVEDPNFDPDNWC